MKYVKFITIIALAFLIGCSDENLPEEDIFDIEWNKNLELEPNKMFYRDTDGNEQLIDIDNMGVYLGSNRTHSMEIDIENETIILYWYDEDKELIPGISKFRFFMAIKDSSGKYNDAEHKGAVNILEVSKGDWEETDIKELPRREIYIKAVFHYKRYIYGRQLDKEDGYCESDIKGVFVYAGYEETVTVLEI